MVAYAKVGRLRGEDFLGQVTSDLYIFKTSLNTHAIFHSSLVKATPSFRQFHTCFGYEGRTGEERQLVIFKNKPINNYQ